MIKSLVREFTSETLLGAERCYFEFKRSKEAQISYGRSSKFADTVTRLRDITLHKISLIRPPKVPWFASLRNERNIDRFGATLKDTRFLLWASSHREVPKIKISQSLLVSNRSCLLIRSTVPSFAGFRELFDHQKHPHANSCANVTQPEIANRGHDYFWALRAMARITYHYVASIIHWNHEIIIFTHLLADASCSSLCEAGHKAGVYFVHQDARLNCRHFHGWIVINLATIKFHQKHQHTVGRVFQRETRYNAILRRRCTRLS